MMDEDLNNDIREVLIEHGVINPFNPPPVLTINIQGNVVSVTTGHDYINGNKIQYQHDEEQK